MLQGQGLHQAASLTSAFGLGLVLAAGPIACRAGGEGWVEPHEGVVRLSVTPGKPGAPTESVEAAKRGGRFVLVVRRVADGGDVLGEGETALPARDFHALWEIVGRNALDRFDPDESGDEVFDFGERRLRIESLATADGERATLEVTWIRPLRNAARVEPLRNALARLASERVPEISLAYLTPR